ncbi:XdhC family protein [Siminovitchia fortis]|uniref:XdhC/CoxI family protein n=1 Tax=Siminovitchia fortis TaxID=254758 RepID=A0A443IV41_9BACI|nr:XdhC/CoxI family protein [Siminovitchia fortis]RWR11956.1 XdhC/CoxI family protein [Siminovitchia fortis]WHY80782.1 XdhC family protein [Siminovitchia fortis]
MTENEKIIQAVIDTRVKGVKAALATVVRVYGSAYRREGAKMLIDEHENRIGMVSGGCLEADVAEVAKQVISSGTPLLKTYDMDEDLVWGLGLGCPGTVDIYIEPVPQKKDPAFDLWLATIKEEQPCVLATILLEKGDSERIFIPKKGAPAGDFSDSTVQAHVITMAQQKMKEKNPKSLSQSFTMENGKEIDIFIDVYMPPAELVIFGAGHDAIPVAQYAVSLGWKTILVDPRPFYNSEERFPGTVRILVDTSKLKDEVKIGGHTYVIVMNHHIERDRETLKYVLPSPSPYIGVLGPRKRRVRMLEAIQGEGIRFTEEQLRRMHSPIGLDIGSETPEEIAISIMAEIIAVQKGHHGGFLQDANTIHQGATVNL